MGLSGKELEEFVEKREKEKNDREERNKERDLKKQALALEHENEQNILKLQLAEKEI